MAKELSESEQEDWWWVRDLVLDVNANDVAGDSGVSLRTVHRIYADGNYLPSVKTREKLKEWAVDLIESERSDCPW